MTSSRENLLSRELVTGRKNPPLRRDQILAGIVGGVGGAGMDVAAGTLRAGGVAGGAAVGIGILRPRVAGDDMRNMRAGILLDGMRVEAVEFGTRVVLDGDFFGKIHPAGLWHRRADGSGNHYPDMSSYDRNFN